ncbi:cytochrome c oxidase subunit 3 [Mycobacterium sp.]|uniref:cytochrome c oxidase subunit 3 n=1 Tax=Mycobacterium sp. TaxID=1785 RepID=UPI00257C3296|nr:cytochrome c oxidase subunit 3 [Mycobacterium sp.]
MRTKTSQGHTPGEPGLWVFILGDMSLFGTFFVVLLWQRRTTPELFGESARELVRPIGVVNTAVLLFSSYLVVLALWAHRQRWWQWARLSVVASLACAGIFAILKVVEYVHVLHLGDGPTTNPFYTYYFVLTGVHFLHVSIGAALLTSWTRLLRRRRPAGRLTEGIAVYWHMVDLLWVLIFTLLYLVCAA